MRGIVNRVIPISACSPHERNYNRHSEQQIGDLCESLRQFGQVRSIVVQQNGKGFMLVAGHGIWEAAKLEGFKELRADVIPASWSKNKVLAYLAADNELGRHADPDQAQLDAIVKELWDADQKELARIAAGEQAALDRILSEAKQAEGDGDAGAELIDRAEELQKKWKCKAGDIYRAGDHFFICDDCRERETWERLLRAAQVEKVNGVFTSPPYAEQRKKQYGGIPTDKYVEWWGEVQARVREHLAGDGSFFVNIKPHCEKGERVLYVFDMVTAMRRKWEWRFVDELCWHVLNGMPGNFAPRFRNAFEPIYHFAASDAVKNNLRNVERPIKESTLKRHHHAIQSGEVSLGRTASQTGSGFNKDWSRIVKYDTALPDNVLDIASEPTNVGHSAAFPVALPEFFIKAYSDPGDVWLDNFLGSGTTIVAAHKNGRRGLGIEKLEKYCAVICERLDLLGLSPHLEKAKHGK